MTDPFVPPTADFLRSRGRVGTLGMFIIDEYAVTDGGVVSRTGEVSIGGGGIFDRSTYEAMTAARMFLPPTHCGLLIDEGDDFPEDMARSLKALGEMVWFRKRQGKTTRAVNIYSGGKIGEGHQSFEYLTKRHNLLLRDLILPPSPFARPHLPEYIHVVTNTVRAGLVVDEMEVIRKDGLEGGVGRGWDGKLIWEPMPSSCVPSELDNILALAPSFLVISPNLLELQTILSLPSRDTPTLSEAEVAAGKLHDLLTRTGHAAVPAVIVRAGELGSYTLSRQWTGWVPPYWGAQQQDKVVDVTGGGNAFLGGLCAGLLISNGDLRTASVYASTAASFAIQQRGLPQLTQTDEEERWNGVDPYQRLRDLARRVDEQEQH